MAEAVPFQDEDDVMDEDTLKRIILCAKIQSECRQLMGEIAEAIANSPPNIFLSEEDKGEVMAYFLDHLRLELGKLNPEEPATLLTPSIFVSMSALLKQENNARHVANYVKSWYGKERAKSSPQEYNRWRDKFYESYLLPGTTRPSPTLHRGGFDAVDAAHSTQMNLGGGMGSKVLHAVWNFGKAAVKSEGGVVQVLNETLTAIVPRWGQFTFAVGTSVGYITFLTIYNLWMCWTGKRTARRAWKNIIDGSVSFVAGTLAGVKAVALAAAIVGGPLGFFSGLFLSAVVGVAVGLTTQTLSDWLTSKIFDIPKEEDLDLAYNFIGLTKSATQTQINRAYRQLSRENHPDKVATRSPPPSEAEIKKSVDKFIKVQKAVALIKTRRNVERANEGIDQSRPWKERFQQFFQNLMSFRWESENKTNKEMEAIAFREGFPPLEIFDDGVDVDVPLRVVENHVRNTWHQFFNSNIQNAGFNPFQGWHGHMM